jgi:uncharacterized membrane protein YqjE
LNAQTVENEPSVVSALERIMLASQRVVGDRIDLVFLEVRELLVLTFRGLLALGLAIGLLLLAWVSTSAMLVFLLIEVMSRSAALGLVAGVNCVAGAVLLRVALSRIAATVSSAETRRSDALRKA